MKANVLTGSHSATAELGGCSHHTVEKPQRTANINLPSRPCRDLVGRRSGLLNNWVTDPKGKIRSE